MKAHAKTLCLMLLVLCTAMTAAAADYSGYYRIKSSRSSKLLTEETGTLKMKASTGNTAGNLKEIWEVRAVADGYVVINASTGNMVKAQKQTNKDIETSATSADILYMIKSNSKYAFSATGDVSDRTAWHEDAQGRVVVWSATSSDANSFWTITAVTGSDLEAAKASVASHEASIKTALEKLDRQSVLRAGGAFRIVSRYTSKNYVTENASTHKMSGVAKAVNDLKQIWIIEPAGDGYHIRNAASGRYVPVTGSQDAAWVTTPETTTLYIKSSEYSADYYTIGWTADFANKKCMHMNATNNVVFWNANDAKDTNKYSDWSLEPVGADDTNATPEAIKQHFGEKLGIASEIKTGYYRLMASAYAGRYLTEDASAKKLTTLPENGDNNQVWYLEVNEETGKVSLRNAVSQNYVSATFSSGAQLSTKTSTTSTSFTAAAADYKWEPRFTFKGSSMGMSCVAGTYIVAGGDVTADNAQWTLYPATVDDEQLQHDRAYQESVIYVQKNVTACNNKLQQYFTDYACTILKDEYASLTAEQLRGKMVEDEMPLVLQDMAVSVLTNTWESKKDSKYNGFLKLFRIQDVQCYSDNKAWKDITQVGPFGELTSPTGIQGQKGDIVILFVDQAAPTGCTLRAMLAYDTEYRNKGELTLKKGINVWSLPEAGEVFITYFNGNTNKQLSEFPNIRVHIEGGTANGCWDLSRGMTNADWTYLKNNFFKGEFLHVKGNNVVLNVLKDNVSPATKPVEIMKGWDFAFLGLQKAIGHTGQWDGRYNPVVNPRHSYQGNPNWGGYGGSNHTGISSGYLFNYDNFYQNNIWEILHEIGHGCQYPIKMAGTTEVTNNSLAQIVSHMMGNNYSRGNGTDRLIQLFNYERDGKRGWSWVDYVRYAVPFYDSSLHTGNHLLYQLYLYFEVMGHSPGFLTRLHNEMRANPITYSGKDKINGTPVTYNDDFWKFAKACAKASDTDLWEFFEAYGFWKYADEIISSSDDDPTEGSAAWKAGNRFIGDYGNYSMKLPVRGNSADEANMAELRAYMKGMGHVAPNLMFIDDHVRKNYVEAESFVGSIERTRVGKELNAYWQVPFVDYGDYRDFDGEDRTSGLHYSIGSSNSTQSYTTDKGGEWNYSVTGRKVTMTGEGILGVKIYDAEGRLVQVANTKTFVIPTEMAKALQDGTYSLHVAATAKYDIIMDKDGNPCGSTSVESTAMDAVQPAMLFDLQGRPSQQLTPGRLYIRGGKKILAR